MLGGRKILPVILVVLASVFIMTLFLTAPVTYSSQDPYLEIHTDERRIWSFDTTTIELVENTTTNETYVNVWIKVEHMAESPFGGTDMLLWHLDVEERRYKVSDTYAYDTDGLLVES
ncbi:MAG: hypothetical protein KGZ94_04115 [Clostridia bacterium]|jgi:hypothetical protein|nr:hypothetical protein [Clostridia bacterium]